MAVSEEIQWINERLASDGVISAAVPFRERDGKRFLTRQDLVEYPYLGAFVARFTKNFELDPVSEIYWFAKPQPLTEAENG